MSFIGEERILVVVHFHLPTGELCIRVLPGAGHCTSDQGDKGKEEIRTWVLPSRNCQSRRERVLICK